MTTPRAANESEPRNLAAAIPLDAVEFTGSELQEVLFALDHVASHTIPAGRHDDLVQSARAKVRAVLDHAR